MELREEILETIINRAAEVFGKSGAEFSSETTFEELGAKSGNYVQITLVLEDKYDIEIPYMDFKRRKSFGEAAAYIEGLIEG